MNARDLAIELADIRAQIKELKLKEDEIEQTLAEEMEQDALILDGIGIFERKRAATRKNWDSDLIRSELLKRVPDMRQMIASTGEYESEAAAYGRILDDAARFDWRSTRLKYYELDPDEYCEKTLGRYQIKMVTVR